MSTVEPGVGRLTPLGAGPTARVPRGLPARASRRPRTAAGIALSAIAVVTVTAALYLAQPVLAPIALALYLALLVSPLVDALRRGRIPRVVSAVFLIAVLGVAAGGLFEATWQPARQWLDGAPALVRVVQRKLRPLRDIMAEVDRTTSGVEHIAGGDPATATTTSHEVLSTRTLVALPGAMVAGFSVLALTAFLLIGGPPLLAQLAASTDGTAPSRAVRAFEAVRSEGDRNFATIAAINIGMGLVTAILATLIGLPRPVLWGCMAAAFSFVPYLGLAVTISMLTVVALVSFDSSAPALIVFLSYLTLLILAGQVLQPLLVGRRLELSPLLVFLAVWIGGWLWGVPGIVLAVPTVVAFNAAAARAPRMAGGPAARARR